MDLVCVVVYRRTRQIAMWLNAWRQCGDCPICVVDNAAQSDWRRWNILRFRPDVYVPRDNCGLDLGAFLAVARGQVRVPAWDRLFWFADDLVPMRPDFLVPFRAQFRPGVGAVGAQVQTLNLRTCAFGITRDAVRGLRGSVRSREDCLALEGGPHNLVQRLGRRGWTVRTAYGPSPGEKGYQQPWFDSCADWLWDTHHAASLNLWERYDQVFGTGYRLPLLA